MMGPKERRIRALEAENAAAEADLAAARVALAIRGIEPWVSEQLKRAAGRMPCRFCGQELDLGPKGSRWVCRNPECPGREAAKPPASKPRVLHRHRASPNNCYDSDCPKLPKSRRRSAENQECRT